MEEDTSGNKPQYFINLKELFNQKFNSDKLPRVVIFTHNYPDPDAIGSMMAVEWMISKLYPSVETISYYDKTISHPQNIAMVNLLDPNLHHVKEYVPSNNDFNILVDTVPANAGLNGNKVDFDLVIDHHKEIPNGGFNGLFINLKAGSCCGTIFNLISNFNLNFSDDNDHDIKVATAIMVGISTDTESLMSDDATEHEFLAWAQMFDYRHPVNLKKIINFERPKFWIEHKAAAVEKAEISEGLGIVGLGIIPSRHRDMIADMADNMISWEDVNTAVAFAIVDGDRIEGCVRSRNASVMVPTLCKELAGKYGNGGGKLGCGAYRYSLAGSSFDEEEDDDVKKETWELLNLKEKKRILRIARK